MSSPRVTNNAVDVDSTTEAEEGKLFVGNLSFHCKEEDLVTLFSECGQVQRTFIHMTTRKYRQPMLYGHVVMGTREQAQAAAIQFNKIIYMGRPIR